MFSYSTSIVVLVGGAQAKFTVHKSLLISRSSFFKKALTGNWVESNERVVRLIDDEAIIFQNYVHPLYTDKIAVSPDPFDTKPGDIDCERLTLAKLYVLAEKLQDVETKNKVLSAMIGSCQYQVGKKKQVLDANFVRTIYGGTMPGSKARRFTVDYFAQQSTGAPFKSGESGTGSAWPSEFTQELLVDVLDKRVAPNGASFSGNALPYMESSEPQH